MDKEYTTSDEEIEIDLENVFINFIVGIKKFGLILIILNINMYSGLIPIYYAANILILMRTG